MCENVCEASKSQVAYGELKLLNASTQAAGASAEVAGP